MNTISFKKIYSKKAKNIRISIKNGEIILVIPKANLFQFQYKIDKKALDFLYSKRKWILSKLEKSIKNTENTDLNNNSREHYLKYKQEAKKLCEKKLTYWSKKMNLTYNKFTVKKLKTKWGSCSIKKNLNFNYKILFLNDIEQDYVIVHELSHLVYMNHSKNFWDLVCKTLGSEKFRKYKI